MLSGKSLLTIPKKPTIQFAEKINEVLDPETIHIHDDVSVRHIKHKIQRIVQVSNASKKPYYFMTDYLEPGTVRCNVINKKTVSGHPYTKYTFALRSKIYAKPTLDKDQENINDDDQKDNQQNGVEENGVEENGVEENEVEDNEVDQKTYPTDKKTYPDEQMFPDTIEENNYVVDPSAQNVIDRLNGFKRGITNRIKYRMMIPPDYPDQTMYQFDTKVIKLNNITKLKNIIEYQGNKNNFNFTEVSSILRKCRCKFLFKINGIIITHTNVYFDMLLTRIYPESIDCLQGSSKLHVMNVLNQQSNKNINTYLNLNYAKHERPNSKVHVKSELKRLLAV